MDKKLKLKTELAKKLKKETSVTGTGASVTPGTGEGVATKYAFGKRDNKGTPSDWKDAPSIPNRSSKAMDYKELWEELSEFVKENEPIKELFNIYPESEDQISDPSIKAIYKLLKAVNPDVEKPISLDKSKPKVIKINRKFEKDKKALAALTKLTGKDFESYVELLKTKRGKERYALKTGEKPIWNGITILFGSGAENLPKGSKPFDTAASWRDTRNLALRVGLLREDEYESLAGILRQLGAEEDSIKVLIKAVEMGALKPTDTITIVKKALGKKDIKEAKLDIDDRIKVTYGNEFYGETGTIVDIHKGFVTVEMDRDGKEYSMHSSDVQKIEDEDDEDMLQEGYAQFRNETKMRSKPDQFHQAVKQIKRKMSEINRIFEYVDRLKTELSEGEDLKYKKYTENAFQQIKESAKALFLKSTKLK